MNKKILCFLISFAVIANFFSLKGWTEQIQSSTKIGVFSLFNPEILQDMNAKVVRFILKDNELKEIYREIDRGAPFSKIELFKKLKKVHEAGIDVIATLRWPDSPGSQYDRVPQGQDRQDSLKLLERFLKDAGEYLKVYSLQNEWLGGPGRYYDKDLREDGSGKVLAIEWFQDLTRKAREVIASEARLSDIKISSPVWQGIQAAVTGYGHPLEKDELRKKALFKIIEFSNQYCDYVDLHLLAVPLEDLPKVIGYVKQHTRLPLITTEWSETHALKKWLKEPMAKQFLKKYGKRHKLKRIRSNQDFVKFCYRRPVDEIVWNDFTSTIPHDPKHIKGCYKLFSKENFIYCCWALGYQYGNPIFDLKCLFANRTTSNRSTPNQPIHDEFISLLGSYR